MRVLASFIQARGDNKGCLGSLGESKLLPVDSRSARSCWIAAALLFAGAALIRINNAYLYPLHFGFDGPANYEYIEGLMGSWALPAPGEGWSTSHPPFFYYLSAALGRGLPGASRAR